MELEFNEEDLATTVKILRQIALRQKGGNDRAIPGSHKDPNTDVYNALYAVVQQPAAEGIIYDPEGDKYFLARRIPGQLDLGIGKVHIFGGWMKPYLSDISSVSFLQDTAMKELGVKLKYLAGPIFKYDWQRGEHPIGFPTSLGYVMKVDDPTVLNDNKKGAWYRIGELPTVEDMIVGRAGELHFMFLRAFFNWVKIGSTCHCIDLNVH